MIGRYNRGQFQFRFQFQFHQMGDDVKSYTVDEALNSLGFGNFQIFVLIYAGMSQISESMEMMLLSFVGPAVQSVWGLSSQEESFITSIVFAGMMIGAYSWGIVSDSYGRRKGFLITAMVTAAAGFLSAFAPNFTSLIMLRGLVGVGLGGGPVLASWFLEFIPAANRGSWMVVFSTFWTIGTVLEASLAWFVMPRLGWRWLLALSSLPSALLLVFYFMTPESPRYLCMIGRKDDALAMLEKIAQVNGRKLPAGVLVTEHHIELSEVAPEEKELISPREANSANPKNVNFNSGFSLASMLLSPELIRSTLLLWMVFFGNAFSYYGLVLLTTELNSGDNTCSNPQMQSKTHDPASVNYRDVFITSFAEFPGLLISAAIVDKLGRKKSMSAMFFLCSLFLLPFLLHQPQSLTTVLLSGARICITATFTIVYIYAPEVYPTSLRSTGVGVASSVGRIGGMICPLISVGLIHGCHQTVAILVFECVIILSGISVMLFPFETRGRELRDNVASSTRGNVSL